MILKAISYQRNEHTSEGEVYEYWRIQLLVGREAPDRARKRHVSTSIVYSQLSHRWISWYMLGCSTQHGGIRDGLLPKAMVHFKDV